MHGCVHVYASLSDDPCLAGWPAFVYLSICLSVYLSICLSPSARLCIVLGVCVSTCCLSIFLRLCMRSVYANVTRQSNPFETNPYTRNSVNIALA